MADYNLTFPDGSTHDVLTGTIDNTYDLPLVGQDAINYGDDFATAYIRLLSSFANTSAPSFGTQRVAGQLWYDTTPLTGGLNIYDGTSWDGIPIDADVVHTSGAESIAGIKTFSDAPDFQSGGSPFTVNSTTAVTNLNANYLDEGGVPRAVSYFATAVQGSKADAAEPGLGNPGVNGYVLSSTTGGTRSWVAAGGGGGGTVDLTDVAGATTPATTFVLLGDNATGVGEAVYTQAANLTYDATLGGGTLSTGTFVGSLTGTATNATNATNAVDADNADNINISSATSSDGTTYPVLVGAASTGNQLPFIDNVDFSYNASTGALSATSFVGSGASLTGINAGTITVGVLGTAYGGTGTTTVTGTGDTVRSASPTLSGTVVIPTINNASGVNIQYNGTTVIVTQSSSADDNTSGARVDDGAGTSRNIGFNDMATTDVSAATTQDLTRATAGHSFRADNSSGAVIFATESADTDIPIGAVWIMRNFTTSTGTVTIQGGAGSTIRHYNGSGTIVATLGSANPFTLARGGVATVVKVADDEYEMWGIGITGGA